MHPDPHSGTHAPEAFQMLATGCVYLAGKVIEQIHMQLGRFDRVLHSWIDLPTYSDIYWPYSSSLSPEAPR